MKKGKSDSFYIEATKGEEIEQGDIFLGLPFFEMDSSEIYRMKESSERVYKPIRTNLEDIDFKEESEVTNMLINAKIRPSIVITQNCDLDRADGYISYCAIRKYADFDKTQLKTPLSGKQLNTIVRQSDEQRKYFYLPQEDNDFPDRMAVDFSLIGHIKKDVAKRLIEKRKFRLNDLALEHFKVKLSFYFKKYAYNRWYVLDKDEFAEYYNHCSKSDSPEELSGISPFPWQK